MYCVVYVPSKTRVGVIHQWNSSAIFRKIWKLYVC